MSEETKTAETTTTSKKTTWLNRIGSAIIGALIAIGSMFGITSSEVAEQKAKTETIQQAASEALDAIKAGDVTTATNKLQEAVTTGKEVVDSAKEVVENVKNADVNEVLDTATKAAAESALKNETKVDSKAETKTTESSDEKKVEAKK